MSWVAAGTASAAATMSAVQYFQNRKQAKKDELNRPKYEIPAESFQGLTLTQQQALQGLPEVQKQEYLANLQRGQSYSLGQAATRKAGLQGIAALNQNQNTGYANLLSQDSAARMGNQKQLLDQLGNMADMRQQKFQVGQLNPYYENMVRQQANQGALTKNLSNAGQMGVYGMGSKGQTKSATSAPQVQTFAPVQGTLNTRPDLAPVEMNYGASLYPVAPDERNTSSNRTGGSNLGWE
jgi:hypothetical protein